MLEHMSGDEEHWQLDDDFVARARFREESAAQRLPRMQHVAAGHDALRVQQQAQQPARRWRRALVVALLTAAVVALLWWDDPRRLLNQAPSAVGPTGGAWLDEQPQLRLGDGQVVAVPPLPPDASPTPLGKPGSVPQGSGGYAFASLLPSGQPVSFDPCRPVHVVVNDAAAPRGSRGQLAAALADTSSATGLRFVVDGQSDEQPTSDRRPVQPERYGERWAPVLVAWTSPRQVPQLAGDTMGIGGGTIYDAGKPQHARYVTGLVALDAPQVASLPAAGRREAIRALLLHELGHLVGLGHVADPTQLMHSRARQGVSTWQDGDLRGLAKLGAGRCYDDA
jgi:hypothetical protein